MTKTCTGRLGARRCRPGRRAGHPRAGEVASRWRRWTGRLTDGGRSRSRAWSAISGNPVSPYSCSNRGCSVLDHSGSRHGVCAADKRATRPPIAPGLCSGADLRRYTMRREHPSYVGHIYALSEWSSSARKSPADSAPRTGHNASPPPPPSSIPPESRAGMSSKPSPTPSQPS